MADNYERQVVNDPLAPNRGAPAQPNQIPLSGVSAPRGANFSQVGEGQRVIAKLLGDAGTLVDQYVDQNRKQWELDGRMAYAQGKTEEELYKTGNKYQMAGFLTMKTDVAANQFLADELDNIDKTGREQDPTVYREGLSKRFGELQSQMGDDPFIKNLVAAKASEIFPRLVSQQTQSNNKWKYEQQDQSYQDMVYSRVMLKDPTMAGGGYSAEEIRKIASPAYSGLKLEDHKKAIAAVMEKTLAAGNTKFAEAMIGVDQPDNGIKVQDLPPTQQVADNVLSTIMSNELHADGVIRIHSDGDGQAIGGINSNAYPEQFAEASRILRDEGQQAALAYIRNFYNQEIVVKNGIGNLAPDVQDVVADGMVNHWAGFQKNLLEAAKGGATRQELLQMRRNEYIRLAEANPAKYGANLDGWLARLNKIQAQDLTVAGPTKEAQNLLTEQKFAATLAANGFETSQINGMVGAYKKAITQREVEFDKNRILTEESLSNTARKEGNLAARLDDIRAAQQIGGYSDKWADQQANKVVTQVNEYNKEQAEFVRLDTAGANGALSFESSDKQKIAIDRKRAAVVGEVSAKPNLTDEQKNEVIRQDMTDYLVRNSVVDPVWSKNINAGLGGNILRKDGTVSRESIKAYQDYIWLKENAPPGYAQNYIKDDAKKVVAMAETMDIRMNSDQALQAAANRIYGKEYGFTESNQKAVNDVDVQKVIDKKIEDELNPGFFSFFSKFQAADAFDVKDSDIAGAKNSSALNNYLMAQTKAILATDPRASVESAANEAWNSTVNRIELAPSGNVLISGSDYNIRQKLGFPDAHATNLVFKALQRYAAKNGKATFGPRYHGVTEDADTQFAMYKASHPEANTTGKDERWLFGKTRDFLGGVHPSSYVASPRGIVWTLRKKGEDGTYIDDGDSVTIPYDVLGDFMREEQFAARSDRSLTDYAKNAIQDLKQKIGVRE